MRPGLAIREHTHPSASIHRAAQHLAILLRGQRAERSAVNVSDKLCARQPLHTEAEPVPDFVFDPLLPDEFDD